MSLQEQFLEAAEKVKNLPQKPSDDELLEIYGFYKQATIGDNCAEMPSVVDIVARRKWEAWNSKSGISKEEAQKSYINYVQTLESKYS